VKRRTFGLNVRRACGTSAPPRAASIIEITSVPTSRDNASA
jgi:hypothetical protein